MYNTALKFQKSLDLIKDKFGINNVHALPRLTKVTLFFNLGNNGSDKKFVESVLKDMEMISGLKPVAGKAKKSNASLKIREGQFVSVYVTLRGEKMFHFLDRLIYVALPRIRDFRGLKKSFDNKGSFTFTVPGASSIMYEANFSQDLNICMNFLNSNADKTESLLRNINIPFVK